MIRFKKISYTTSRQLYDRLSANLKSYSQVNALSLLIGAGQTIGIGKQALAFTGKDVNGKIISLENFRGKYVLVDFWASWCHPCRAENPFIVKAYEKYKDNGFDVFGVSLDAVREQWLNALKQDKMVWTQVCNLKGFRDEVVLKYGITAIPRNFLIDPSGKIIAMDLRGNQLETKLSMIFKENQ